MRTNDTTKHPAAVARDRNAAVRMWAGLVIAAAGLVAVFAFKEVYVGFGVALVGAGILPAEKVLDFLPFGRK